MQILKRLRGLLSRVPLKDGPTIRAIFMLINTFLIPRLDDVKRSNRVLKRQQLGADRTGCAALSRNLNVVFSLKYSRFDL